MEKRKESLCDRKLCRFCLTQDSSLTSLYDRSRDPILVTLPLKIMACVSIEVFPSDKMPSFICERCRAFMDICYDFKQICRRADESCLQYVQNGAPISAIKWPPSLMKIFQLTKKVAAGQINAQVELPQLAAQEMSENDDEDEETYDVKIGATRAGTKSLKVTPSGNKETASAKKTAVCAGVVARPRRRSRGARSWACGECDHSYRLFQLLRIHRAQKHGANKEHCSRCDAKFFSKYDLFIHEMRHANATPYQCVGCGEKFKRLILLKRHEKIMHRSLPHFECTMCPSKFLSSAELEAHYKRHEGDLSRQHSCGICDRKFHKSHTLRRHEDIMHGNKRFACEYCPERFSTTTKLVRHVRTHASDRAYPCKYCNKSFIKSNHYSRHLRLKHEEEMAVAGNSAESEFRCEQCGESFATQDELYYHSAIHATQNLTCPLCQEKFENVDAVTSHIRTHVNGIEFMCDFCELVFTSKEKLDCHMIAAHDAEMERTRVDLDESSMEADGADDADADDDDEDNGLEVTEEDDHMVVKIQKTGGFMLRKGIEVGQTVNTNSEDSDVIESTYPEAPAPAPVPARAAPPTKSEATSSRAPAARSAPSDRISIVRKAEAMKRKAGTKEESNVPQKKERAAKVDSTTNSTAANDKSLRMLEKDLQDLKRTITRIEGKPTKAEAKSKRQPVHTSTSKPRSGDEKKSQTTAKLTAPVEKKAVERRQVTKDNKESKESVARNTVTSSREDKSVSSTKDDKPGAGDRQEKTVNKDINDKKNAKEDEGVIEKPAKGVDNTDKEDKNSSKEVKTKTSREDVPSSSNKVEASSSSKADKNVKNEEGKEVIKNGDTSSSEESMVRRSTRPSKIKNYANMIRERTRMIRDDDDLLEDSDEEEEYVEEDADSRTPTQRKSIPKRQRPAPAPAPPPAPTPPPAETRRRGRPRKDQSQKDTNDDVDKADGEKETVKESIQPEEAPKEPEVINKEIPADSQAQSEPIPNNKAAISPTSTDPPVIVNTILSPMGQTLKKVPIQSLPPGVKPLPLPLNARRDLCQMQIGKKMVKVQKIVMTKAEVEDMAKKGLLELKGKTMVLKPGTKLPGGEPTVVRSGLVSEGAMRKAAAAPTRCNLQGEEA